MADAVWQAVVVHADASCIVVDKPSGLLSVPGRGAHLQDCMAARVQAQFGDALVVHRLDMATSGLMVFARGIDAQRALSRAFAAREVHKRYIAIVQGRLPGAQGEIDLPLIADWPNRPRQKVDHAHGKPSRTRWRVVGAEGANADGTKTDFSEADDANAVRTRVELEPVTGRAHQLRVHLLAIGHPIVGDALYAPPDAQAGAPRLLLHATQLGFSHPDSGTALRFDSAAPF